jgi:hypothetical protein
MSSGLTEDEIKKRIEEMKKAEKEANSYKLPKALAREDRTIEGESKAKDKLKKSTWSKLKALF